jgi:glucose/arabinose dehydrogenase
MLGLRTFVTALVLVIGTLSLLPYTTHALVAEPGFVSEVVAEGFDAPTAMTFTEDGRIFVAQKNGVVRVIQNGALVPAPVITLPNVNDYVDRGLIGIAADPNFETNGYLYLSYTHEGVPTNKDKAGVGYEGEKVGRIVRVTVVGNTASVASMMVLVGNVGATATATSSCENYAVTADCIPSDSPSHSAGGLRFGPDGKLYASLGDGAHFDYADARAKRAQNIDSLAGKILRINTDGTAPADNPFYNGNPNANRSKVFAFGIRNSFRFNFHPTTGQLFAGDVGWFSFEEVNRIVAGGNYGWPCREALQATRDHSTREYCATPVSAYTNPIYSYPHGASNEGSITAGTFSFGDVYPDQYDTSLFIGDYAQNWIKRLVLASDGTVAGVYNFDMNQGEYTSPFGPVDITAAPNGVVYYISIYNGAVNRIRYIGGNRAPIPAASATPNSGLAPLSVAFSSAGSVDPDGDVVTYQWDFGDGTASSTVANPTYTYTKAGVYTATLTLTDSKGALARKTVTVTANNRAPSVSIVSPTADFLYQPGQKILVVGTSTDPEDGPLPASAYTYDIILHHNVHTHDIASFTGTSTPAFIAPDHNATDVFVEIKLTVTDKGGLKNTVSTNIHLAVASTTPAATTTASTTGDTAPTTGGGSSKKRSSGGGGGSGATTTTSGTSTVDSKQWIHTLGPKSTTAPTIKNAGLYGKPYFTYRGKSALLLKAHESKGLIVLVAGSGSLLQKIGGYATLYKDGKWVTVPLAGVRPKNTDGTYTGMAYYILRTGDPLYSPQGGFAAKVTMKLPGCDNATCAVDGWLLQEYKAK